MDKFLLAAREISETYNEALKLARECNTNLLRTQMNARVYKIFRLLCPISYEPMEFTVKSRYGSSVETMRVQEWVRNKYSSWYKLGSPVLEEDVLWAVDELGKGLESPDTKWILDESGKPMQGLVRQAIKSILPELITLSRELVRYNGIKVTREMRRTEVAFVEIGEKMETRTKVVDRIVVDSSSVLRPSLGEVGKTSLNQVDLTSVHDMMGLENVVSELREAYRELNELVSKSKKQNESILARMEEVAGPMALVKN